MNANKPFAKPAKKYNPYHQYKNRQTITARRRNDEIERHQFRDSIGGDSSNYRK